MMESKTTEFQREYVEEIKYTAAALADTEPCTGGLSGSTRADLLESMPGFARQL